MHPLQRNSPLVQMPQQINRILIIFLSQMINCEITSRKLQIKIPGIVVITSATATGRSAEPDCTVVLFYGPQACHPHQQSKANPVTETNQANRTHRNCKLQPTSSAMQSSAPFRFPFSHSAINCIAFNFPFRRLVPAFPPPVSPLQLVSLRHPLIPLACIQPAMHNVSAR